MTDTPHPPPHRPPISAGVWGFLGVLLGLVVGAAGVFLLISETTPGDPDGPGDVVRAAEIAAPSVVRVDVRGIGGDGASGNASGVVLDADGHVATNDHVVAGATSISVTFASGNTAPATLVGSDPATDLAVIRVRTQDEELTPITLGDISRVVVGQPVLAIGSPFGLNGTVTAGIVSALDRPVDLRGVDGTTVRLPGVIQTDARISPGNSGGPLLDTDGRLIGVSSSILGEETRGDIGFAIPVDIVRATTQTLITDGGVAAPYLGVATTEAEEGGALVDQVVAQSPADVAGVQAGDRILAVGDREVGCVTDLVSAIQSQEVGATIDLRYIRDGAEVTASVQLSDGPP